MSNSFLITAEQVSDIHKANMEMWQSLADQTVSCMQSLSERRLSFAKDALSDAFNYTQAAFSAKDIPELTAVQSNLLKPLVLKYVSYRSHVYDTVAGAGSDSFKSVANWAEKMEKHLSSILPAVGVLTSAVNVSQQAIQTAQVSAKKAVEVAESNLASISNGAVGTLATATSSSSRKSEAAHARNS